MVQYLFLASVCLGSLSGSQERAPNNPFELGKAERLAGNPLKHYTELLERESEIRKMDASLYDQLVATALATMGDVRGATEAWGRTKQPFKAKGPILESHLMGMKPIDAVVEIVRKAEHHQVVMLGEEHVKPQSRCLMIPLLRALRKKGFTYFAAETFNLDLSETIRCGYPLLDTGTYTQDPVFAQGVREAMALGYKLVPYEATEQAPRKEDPTLQYYQNFRERTEAQNLKERILDKDPKAKIIVWAGRAHVYESTAKVADDEWTPMAYCFRQITGIDPLSVYLANMLEESSPALEWPAYRYATSMGLVKTPTVFVDRAGNPYGDDFDVMVFFPKVTYIRGRADWLSRTLGRVPVEIPESILAREGMQLVQAFVSGEPLTAVPIDQILILPGDPVPVLMLPKGGSFDVRSINPAGDVQGVAKLKS
ncbi:MAG: hypothetical protein HZC36_08270 [Armatimonadetes bacterium]|nr:hypothetical protein [Armatimonadota bacterium]